MFCKNCGTQLNEGQAVCLNCGVKAGEGSTYCANCGNALNPNASVCMNCGVAVGGAGTAGGKQNNLNGQDKTMMIIMCILLGGIGIHNFMMGETKKGIFKIIMCLCCGIGYIFAIIDLVKICTDSYVADPNALI